MTEKQRAKQLEKEGFEVTYLGTDEYGRISLEELKNAIRPDTVLVSVMGVNNEIGTVEPVAEAGELIQTVRGVGYKMEENNEQ